MVLSGFKIHESSFHVSQVRFCSKRSGSTLVSWENLPHSLTARSASLFPTQRKKTLTVLGLAVFQQQSTHHPFQDIFFSFQSRNQLIFTDKTVTFYHLYAFMAPYYRGKKVRARLKAYFSEIQLMLSYLFFITKVHFWRKPNIRKYGNEYLRGSVCFNSYCYNSPAAPDLYDARRLIRLWIYYTNLMANTTTTIMFCVLPIWQELQNNVFHVTEKMTCVSLEKQAKRRPS